MASLIGEGPGQYLLFWEDRASFDGLKAAFDQELRPTDPIERMWADEIVDLEWDLHRMRRTRRTVVENALVERLTQRVVMMNAVIGSLRPVSDYSAHSADAGIELASIKHQARKCVLGDPAGHQYIGDRLGVLKMEDELQFVQAEQTEVLASLEYSIHATSRLRDAVLARLYGRRNLIADNRAVSGQIR